MNGGRIIKVNNDSGYARISNQVLQSNKLSMQAKGLFSYLQSLPPDWVVYKSKLHEYFDNGRDAVAAAFTELIEFGVIEQVKDTTQQGKFSWNYNIYPIPKTANSQNLPITDSQGVVPEKPSTTVPEKPLRVSSAYTKKETKQNNPKDGGEVSLTATEKPQTTPPPSPSPAGDALPPQNEMSTPWLMNTVENGWLKPGDWLDLADKGGEAFWLWALEKLAYPSTSMSQLRGKLKSALETKLNKTF